MKTSPGIVVVGASAAGLAASETLRRQGYEGRLTLVGQEEHPPYDRPPLSKQLLSGSWEPDKLRLRAPEVYQDLQVEQLLGLRADSLDIDARRVTLSNGDQLDYESLIIATGTRARSLSEDKDTAGVHVLRTLEDALALRSGLTLQPHLVIVGGGFVGAEAAAVARSLGCGVTLITSGRVPLANSVGEEIGTMLADIHRDNGVQLITGAVVEEIVSTSDRATGVRLADGRIIDAGAVLVGIGAAPNTDWLSDSGLSLSNGVDCDSRLNAGTDVWAAGDVASWPDPHSGVRLRIEHRTNATEQGMAVARNILAGHSAATPFTTVPYVWSDQYDMKVQIYGRTRDADEVHLVEGRIDDRRFTALYATDGMAVAALGVNMPRPLRRLRSLVAAHTSIDEALASLPVSI